MNLHDVHAVQVFNGQCDFAAVEARAVLAEAPVAHEVVEQLAARTKFHNQVQLPRRLERAEQPHDERVLHQT